MYLNYHRLTNGMKPYYWDKDRRWFATVKYLHDEKVEGEDYFANDGVNNIDRRRSGKTARAACMNLEIATRSMFFHWWYSR